MEEAVLIFARNDNIFHYLINKSTSAIKEKRTFVLIKPGDIYRQLGQYIFQINPKEKEDYIRLVKDIKNTIGDIVDIFHLWNYDSSNLDYVYHGDIKKFILSLNRNLNLGVESVSNITDAMTSLSVDEKASIFYLYHGNNENLQPQNIMITNSYMDLAQEQSKYRLCSINLHNRDWSMSQVTKIILDELDLKSNKKIESVQYNIKGERKEFSLEQNKNKVSKISIKSNGVYVIVNNKRDYGWNFAIQLLERFKCKVIVIDNKDVTQEKKEIVSRLNKDNNYLNYKQVNISSFEDVKEAFHSIKSEFYSINGIIYNLDSKDDDTYKHNIDGILITDDYTSEIPLDFYVVTSESLNSVSDSSIYNSYRFGQGFCVLRNKLTQQVKRFGLSHTLKWNIDNKNISLINTFISELGIDTERIVSSTVKKIDLSDDAIKAKLLDVMTNGITKLIAGILKVNDKEISMDFSINLDSSDGLKFDSVSLTMLAEKIRAKYDVKLTPVVFFKYKKLKVFIDFLFDKYRDKFFEYYKIQLEQDINHEQSEKTNIKNHDNNAFKNISDKVEDYGKQDNEIFEDYEVSEEKNSWTWLKEKQIDNSILLEDENAVAIIGASGMFAKSSNLEEFWNNIVAEKDLISEIPAERWDWKGLYGDPHKEDNKTNIKWGGFIKDIDCFDPDFFDISHEEAKIMDPQQRIFLETAWKTIEDAGYKISDLSASNTAVFVGAGDSEYYEMMRKSNVKIIEQSSTAKSNSILANRISYLFNLKGASESIDVACASSLVAIHKATEEIKRGECELALAGGVHLNLTPNMFISYNMGGVLAEDGKCRAFDKKASGYVRGEGVGAVLLKPLKKAVADNDHIYAVILGSAVNHGGRSNSMTSPSPTAQEEVLEKSYKKAKISPSTVNYIEAHGTGTNLGDPIEIMALNNVFKKLTERENNVHSLPYCGIGSVKTNIGHTEEASGMASIFKVILGMKHKKIPGNIHFSELNPYIDNESGSLYVVDKTIEWNRINESKDTYLPLRAGVSSFGFGGVNAHLVLQEYKQNNTLLKLKNYLIPLSAQDKNTLEKYVAHLLEFLENGKNQTYSLIDIAYTLQVGREEMSERLALVVDSKEELINKLKKYLKNKADIDLYTGKVEAKIQSKSNNDDIESLINNKEYENIAKLWAIGEKINWKLFYEGYTPNKISLPTYPFNKRSFWFTDYNKPKMIVEDIKKENVNNDDIDKEKILVEWNDTLVEYPKNTCVYEMIEEQAQKTPDSIAVVFEGESLTYKQLVNKVNEFTTYFRINGVKRGSYVGIFLNRSIEMLAGILAIMKAGGTYIPLDPVYPKDRISYIINDTKLRYIITQKSNINKLPKFEGKVFDIYKDMGNIEKESLQSEQDVEYESKENMSEQIAYVIYTSGSTGNPKGVQIYHRSLTNFLYSMSQILNISEKDYLLAVTTLCFDIAGLELYLPLIVGGTVEILSQNVAKDGIQLKEKIEEGSATVMQGTPATWQMLLTTGWNPKVGFKILCGGEALSQELADKLVSDCDEVWNLYGPTETTIWSTAKKIKKGEKISIGRPIGNTFTYILDDELRPVPIGVKGELYIGGEGLAKGYLNRPNLNKNKFIQNPFVEGQYIYRTGDRAYYNENGNICFEGRIDNQIKLRGYRIELEEIEKAFCDITEVEKAIVVVRDENLQQKSIVVFYTLKEANIKLTRLDILNCLNKRLPEYMIPTLFIQLETFPMTMNLKIDRKVLSQMDLNEIEWKYGNAKKITKESLLDVEVGTSLENDIKQIVIQITNMSLDEIQKDVKLGEYGFNSALFTNLAVLINKKFDINTTAIVFYKYSTISEIADYLLKQYPKKIENTYMSSKNLIKEISEYSISKNNNEDESIAIIGMYGSMPQSPNPSSFWNNLLENKNMVSEVPKERWDYEEYFGNPLKQDNKTDSKWGGFVSDVDCFDASFFKISPREAELMDPRQRLLIETVWKTFEDAGYKSDDFIDTDTGMFIGAINSDYWDVIRDCNIPADGYTLSGFANSIIPNRISYLFNLRGPSEAIDTACSSSLTAIDRAINALKNGDCEMAIAGGVNLILSPYLYLSLSKNGMLSPDGKCKAFDKSANGYVRGEGVGTILLKPLSKAIRDGDNIYAVIKSTAVNHGGRANSLTAPNPEAQTALLKHAYTKAGIDPATVTYIETHGTGTKLGDPIEIDSLKTAFEDLYKKWGKELPKQPHCALGAVKTNIGHLEAAAGIAGVIKTVLAMKNGIIPANINFEEINPYISLEDSCLYLVNENKQWRRLVDDSNKQIPRRAGVSSFGFGGANAHIVIEEHIKENKEESKSSNVIILSANSEKTLAEYAKELLDFVNNQAIIEEQSITTNQIAYTLQTGRDVMDVRVAFVVDSIGDLKEKLKDFISKKTHSNVYSGRASDEQKMIKDIFTGKAGEEYFKILIEEIELDRLARLWASGAEINWNRMYLSEVPNKISLPTYPFAKDRYWVSKNTITNSSLSNITCSTLTPLIDTNESDLYELCYKKTLSPQNLFVREHVVMGEKILPGVVYLEMARMAGSLVNKGRFIKKLKNIVWLRPIEVKDTQKEVYINLYPKDDDIEFSINTRVDDKSDNTQHAQGKIIFGEENQEIKNEFINISEIMQRCLHQRLHEEFYNQFYQMGYDYKETFKPISELFYNEVEAIAEIILPKNVKEGFYDYVLHPSIMEGVLQTLAGLLIKKNSNANVSFLPFSMSELEILHPFSSKCYSYIRVSDDSNTSSGYSRRYDITLVDENGLILAKFKDYSVRTIEDKLSPVFYSPQLKNVNINNEKRNFDGAVVVFDYDEGFVNYVKQQVNKEDDNSVILIRNGEDFMKITEGIYQINPLQYNDYKKLFIELKDRNLLPERIIYKWNMSSFDYNRDNLNNQLKYGVYSPFYLFKSMIEQKIGKEIYLVYAFYSNEIASQPLLVSQKSMIKSLKLENPWLNCRVVQFNDNSQTKQHLIDSYKLTLSELFDDNKGNDYVLYENGKRFVEVFEKVNIEQASLSKSMIKEGGVYLITGGAGGLGNIFAQYIAKKSKAKIILVGRSELAESKELVIKEIEVNEGEAIYEKADISSYEDVQRLYTNIKHRFGNLNGIIHCAGEIRDEIILKKDIEDFKKVISAKVQGTINLDEVFKDEALDFFVLFSSISSVLGNVGQTDYTFANGFLDAFSIYRKQLLDRNLRSGKTLSLNWPLWKDGGMQVDDEVKKFIANFFGISFLETDYGLRAFELALDSEYSQLLILQKDSYKVKELLGIKKQQLLNTKVKESNSNALINDKNIFSKLSEDIISLASKILKIDVQKIDINKDIYDYGFDSISFTELANKINDLYKCDITPAVFFELELPTITSFINLINERYFEHIQNHYSNIIEVNDSIDKTLDTDNTQGHNKYRALKVKNNIEVEKEDKNQKEKNENDAIAIIGISGVMPQSKDLKEFWENLEAERDLISEVPEDRFDWRNYYGDPLNEVNKTDSKWGGFMKEVDKFDALFFGISPREAELMDPQHRIFMQIVWKAIEDSGYKFSDLSGTNTGVYVGITNRDYLDVIDKNVEAIETQGVFGNTHPFLPNRISYLLNLHGPSEPIDTLCSSSLVAIHRAVEDIKHGNCEMAIAGGVSVIASPRMNIAFSRGKMLSNDGHSKTFDNSANGFVRGEGAGAIILKPLKKALEDGDNIYSIIRGTAENHGGRSNSLTAPNANAQSKLLVRAYEDARISPNSISYIETHGTGTVLGDPVEVNGLKTAFKKMYEKQNIIPNHKAYCGLGSVKTNIGHLEAAAGIAGVLKVILSMKNKKIPASINFNKLNDYIDLKESPFYVVDKTCKWQCLVDEKGKEIPRIAGISSFGAGGTNAHVILQEFNRKNSDKAINNDSSHVIVFSAKDKDSLKENAKAMLSYLKEIDYQEENNDINLLNIAYTLQNGREAMEERLAIIVSNIDELKKKINAFINKEENIKNLYCNNEEIQTNEVHQDKIFIENAISEAISKKDFDRIGELWVQGTNIDWWKINDYNFAQRIPLPTYSFARESYWIEKKIKSSNKSKIHPLIHNNISHSLKNTFASEFEGNEFFFTDHVVGDKKMLPGVAYIEMAKVGGELITQKKVAEIRNVVWMKPLIAEHSKITINTRFTEQEEKLKFEIKSVNNYEDSIIHAEGEVVFEDLSKKYTNNELIDIDAIVKRCNIARSSNEIYEYFLEKGFHYGTCFRAIKQICLSNKEALSHIKLPIESKKSLTDFNLHPSLIDAGLQTAVELLGVEQNISNKSYMPFSLGKLEIVDNLCEKEYYAHAVYSNKVSSNSQIKMFNIFIVDKSGRILVTLEDFSIIALKTREISEEKKLQYYETQWKEKAIELNEDKNIKGNLIVFNNDVDLSDVLNLKNYLSITIVKESNGYREINDNMYEVKANDIENYKQLISTLKAKNKAPDKIIHAWCLSKNALSNNELDKNIELSYYSILNLTKALLSNNINNTVSIDFIHPISNKKAKPEFEAVSGLLKTIQIENPRFKGRTIGINLQDINTNAGLLVEELTQNKAFESEVKIIEGKRYVKQFVEINGKNIATTKTVLKENGTYIITGGAGGLGLIFSEHLIAKYRANLILVGRSELSKEQRSKLYEFQNTEAKVLYIKADIANRENVNKLISSVRKQFKQINGVIHCAGVIRDSYIINKKESDIEEVLNPKIYGTTYIDEELKNDKLDFFAVFSSFASVTGNQGQSDYAYANSYMNNYSVVRELLREKGERSGKTLSINWTLWKDGKMNVNIQAEKFFKEVMGIYPLDTKTGIKVFEEALKTNSTDLIVLQGDNSKIKDLANSSFSVYTSQAQGSKSAIRYVESNVSKSEKELEAMAIEYLKKKLSKVTKLPLARIKPNVALEKYGIDSLMILNLNKELEEDFSNLSKTLFFEYQTIQELAKYFVDNHKEKIIEILCYSKESNDINNTEITNNLDIESKNIVLDKSKVVEDRTREKEDIAIIGLSGTYPNAENLDQFWENLKVGKDCIVEIPEERWNHGKYYDSNRNNVGKSYSKWGSFIEDVDKFDPMFFNISPKEAEFIDPQERLFLSTVWHGMEDAGYTRESLNKNKIGVFVGVMYGQYQLFKRNERTNTVYGDSFYASIANRVSYMFNLRGPSIALDTMCSSSITTVHMACESIYCGECDMAFAGGVNLSIHPNKYIYLSRTKFASSDGHCRSFGVGGDGYVPGEGVGVVLLKPLSKAIQDGDNIYAVIKGSSINHGGKTNGYTVPNPNAQANLMLDVFKKTKINPRTISYVEAHGTGTSLGDPIELTGLNKAYNEFTTDKQYCSIGSIKSNIGHLESAAGIAGITKVLLQMKYKQLVPSIHSEILNPNMDFENSPFYVQRKLSEWNKPVIEKNGVSETYPRRAGVSAFGAGGSNAHILLEEFEHREYTQVKNNNTNILVISARNKERLLVYASNILSYLRKHDSLLLEDIVFTLQVGREAMNERVAIIIQNISDLLYKLSEFCNGNEAIDGIYVGNVRKDMEILDSLIGQEDEAIFDRYAESREYNMLAKLWACGADCDWMKLYSGGETPRRISLPVYPFLKERIWINDNSKHLFEEDTQITTECRKLHTLINSNISTLKEEKFLTILEGNEYYLNEHKINNQKILPGAIYLEMARATGELATGEKVWKIQDVLWSRALTVDDESVNAFTKVYPETDYIGFDIFTVKDEHKDMKHSNGKLLMINEHNSLNNSNIIDIQSIKNRLENKKEKIELYESFANLGIEYGTGFKVIQELYYNNTEALYIVKLPQGIDYDNKDYVLNPMVIDGAFQGASVLLGQKEQAYIPYSIEEVEISKALDSDTYYVYACLAGNTINDTDKSIDILITNTNGEVDVSIHNIVFKEKKLKVVTDISRKNSKTLFFSKSFDKKMETVLDLEIYDEQVIVFDKDVNIYSELTRRFKSLGKNIKDIYWIQPGSSYKKINTNIYQINISSERDYRELFADINVNGSKAKKIVHLLSYEQDDYSYYDDKILKTQLDSSIYSLFYITKSLIESKSDNNVQLLCSYISKEAIPQYDGISGFFRSIERENRKYKGKILRIEKSNEKVANSDKLLNLLIREFNMKDDNEVVVNYDTGDRYVANIKEIEHIESNKAITFKENGVYLITGGMGDLGLIFAEHITKQVNAKLVLIGRSDLNNSKLKKIDELKKLGAEVVYYKGSIISTKDMQFIIKDVKERFKGINGIIHSAGITRDSLISQKTKKEFEEVIEPKVYGAKVLDELTKDESLDFMVFFSSISGLMGNSGQSDYAFANCFMDNLAGRRETQRAKGLRQGKTISINWPLWSDGGMTVDEPTKQLLRKTMGTEVLDKQTGLNAFESVLSMNQQQVLVVKGDEKQIKEKLGIIKKAIQTNSISLDNEQKESIINNIQLDIIGLISKVLKIKVKDIEIDEEFNSYGFDSVSITEFVNNINEKYDLEITPANFYEYSNVQGLAKGLYEENESLVADYYLQSDKQANEDFSMEIEEEKSKISARFVKEESKNSEDIQEDVAIIGISGTLVQSEDLKEFWKHLEAGEDLITEIPEDRWDWREYYGDANAGGNKTTVKWGGFMKEIDKFDAELFSISPHEAKLMDPQQRIFLETVWKAIEDSGYKVSDFAGTKTGVYVGVSNMDYYEFLNEYQDEIEAHVSTGNAHSIIANRISYLLDTHGPSEPINTACSSSLVAIHKAVEAIRTGSCNMAIAGGVNVIISPRLYISFDKAGMLSNDGRCKTFDKSANGYVRGEGSGAVLLKSLVKAKADGDYIYAIIKGSAINHCGRTNSLTAPSPNAQADVIADAIKNAKVNPEHITYIEAHGTGTSLGDPIEINGLKKAFEQLYKEQNSVMPKEAYCGIGAVKTNIGHLESAAGIAGLLKVILAIKHKKIPKNVHFNELNPYINIKKSPFYIASQTQDWNTLKDSKGNEISRIAGVSSFGFGGVNAHIVLEEYKDNFTNNQDIQKEEEHLFILSAKSHEGLNDYVANIMDNLIKVKDYSDIDIIFRRTCKDLIEIIKDILHINRDELIESEEFTEYGFDVVNLNELVNRVNEKYDISISYSDITECSSVELLSHHLSKCYNEKLKKYYFINNEESKQAIIDKDLSLRDICYTLQVGRESMKSKIAFIVSSLEELVQKLALYLDGKRDIDRFYSNELYKDLSNPEGLFDGKSVSDLSNNLIADKQLDELAQMWIYGTKIQWNMLYSNSIPRRIPLQSYPFEKKSYWIDSKGFKKHKAVKYNETQTMEVLNENTNTKEIKSRIIEILSKVLSQGKENIQESIEFSALGLDSILNIKLVKLLNSEFGIELNPIVVVQNPTIELLSKYIESKEDNKITSLVEKDNNTEVKLRVKSIISKILSLNVGEIDEKVKFTDMGLDSILGIKLTKMLNKEFGVNINPVKIIENPTIEALSDYLVLG